MGVCIKLTANYFSAIMHIMHGLRRVGFIIIAVLVIGTGFGVGVYVGMSQRPAIEQVTGILNKEPIVPLPQEADFSSFWRTWSVVEQKYAGDEPIDRQAMIYGAIEGMVRALGDPYTVFFPPKELEQFESDVKGRFEGIGAEIGMRKGILTIIAPLKGSPAAGAGLHAGDKVFKIDDTITSDLSLDEAVRLIRGEKGTKVTLTILRNGNDETQPIEIIRDTIRVPVLDTQRKDGGIFVIQLHNFSEDSPLEFRKALSDMARSGDTKLLLDLRNNPGGYLEAAVDIASWFMKAGDVVVREQFNDGKETVHRSKGYAALKDIPTVVLMNEGSASASEILAGALRDNRQIILIGKKTFGKGSVQEVVDITDNTSVKVTIARWLTPSGKSLSENGLNPDIEVNVTAEDMENTRDPQLDRAVEALRGM